MGREFRVASRQAVTWRLRLVFATAALLALGFGFSFPDLAPEERGLAMLIAAASMAFPLSLFLGVALTADSLSREKREGTLGLLLLTPLSGLGIVMGKMASHATQALYAWLAMLPCFFIPVLYGGVTGREVVRVLLALLLTWGVSLAIGLFWSALRTEARATVMGSVSTLLLLTFLPWLPSFLTGFGPRSSVGWSATLSPLTLLIKAFAGPFSVPGNPREPSGAALYWGSAAWCLLLAVGLTWLAGWLLPARWRAAEAGTAAKAPGTNRTTTRRWARGRSATDWLAARSERIPMGIRVLCGSVTLFFGAMLLMAGRLAGNSDNTITAFVAAFSAAYGLHLIIRVYGALVATRRWFEDRRAGVLELLLVTPLPEPALIEAYHAAVGRGLRSLFGLALLLNLLLEGCLIARGKQFYIGEAAPIYSVFFLGGALLTWPDFLALRWLGLRFALTARTHLRAAGLTFAALMGLPWLAFGITFLLAAQSDNIDTVVSLFFAWVVGGLFYDAVLILRCREWAQAGLRQRLTEST